MKIAIIDHIGLTYDGTTLEKFGLGGSESAIIYMGRELQALGFEVTVFNNCTDSRAKEGVYDGVTYVDLSRLNKPNDFTCDIMIGSRSVVPFLPQKYHSGNIAPIFSQLKNSAKLKILWMHDTFCNGDQVLEELVVNKDIDEIFTLSDFHTTYVANCDHGNRRNFEVLKNKIFMTRNGARKYIHDIEVRNKDKNQFIYNASVTKGMIPLVEKIWPLVKQQIPTAKLKIIGGYYRFRDGAEPDAQEKKLRELMANPEFSKLDIEFTGVIPQPEIATHLAKASFMIFPGAFPETFGISSLEALLHNTPLITTTFGALEETAVDLACYKINYAIEPNSLFPGINTDEQVKRFVSATVAAYNNHYLHYQKMNYCNIVHDIAGWDTVALQWKQHIYKKIGLFLSVDEFRKVTKINNRVHEVFGRRFSNYEEWNATATYPQRKIVVVSPVFNAESYIQRNIMSVAQQDYDNYEHIIIDDLSTDSTREVALTTINSLPENIREKFKLLANPENFGAVQNYVDLIRRQDSNSIIVMLDGDDWLMNNNMIFQKYNTLYDEGAEFTYGSMWSMVDNIPLIAQQYPKEVREKRTYRSYKFPWNMPYTHLRTFIKKLIDRVDESVFKDEKGNWLRAGGDTSIFYNVLEQAHPDKVVAVTDVVYCYNDMNPLNDYKVNGEEQTRTANAVLEGKGAIKFSMPKIVKQKEQKMRPEPIQKKRILLGIPTAKYIEVETFKSIYDLDIPEDVELTFQYFYGYNIDQVRNLIAQWASNFDYLFSVDSDIVLPKDCLTKMLNHDVDVVSGVYRQRIEHTEVIEIHRKNEHGGVSHIPFSAIQPAGLHEIDSCGFGCVLVKSDVIRKIGYPQFKYHSALDHRNTVSEDIFFCKRAKEVGAKIYVDSSIVCDHKGTTMFKVRAFDFPG